MRLLILITLLVIQSLHAADVHATAYEGTYLRHLQGICTNDKDAIYWCWTDFLVKTDPEGRVLKKEPVASHHGDLCFHDGRVNVATNLVKFNRPAGDGDSWVYVYDEDSLAELVKHRVPEVLHGAGGMAWYDGRFFIVGGLPLEAHENYVYEYDSAYRFQKCHVLDSGYTHIGIQTVAQARGVWWFGCYGKPAELLRADENMRFNGKWEFNASVGIAPISAGRFLIAQNTSVKGNDGKTNSNTANVVIARVDGKAGLVNVFNPASK